MRLEYLDSNGQPGVLDVRRLVIRTDKDDIVAAAIEYQPDMIYVAHLQDTNFERMLGAFGLDKTKVKIETLQLADQ